MADPNTFHLAQINVAWTRFPLDRPEMQDFVDALDRVNSVADRSPGFVWRLQDDGGNATSFRAFDDERIIVNMSVWQSIDHLFEYTYRHAHLAMFQRRQEWFVRAPKPSIAMWWIPAGRRPPLEDGVARLETLWRNGPSPQAFTFKQRYDANGNQLAASRSETGAP